MSIPNSISWKDSSLHARFPKSFHGEIQNHIADYVSIWFFNFCSNQSGCHFMGLVTKQDGQIVHHGQSVRDNKMFGHLSSIFIYLYVVCVVAWIYYFYMNDLPRSFIADKSICAALESLISPTRSWAADNDDNFYRTNKLSYPPKKK